MIMNIKHKDFMEKLCQQFIDYVVEQVEDVDGTDSTMDRIILTDELVTGFVLRIVDHISNPEHVQSFPINVINLTHSILEMASKINWATANCKHEECGAHHKETH